MDLNTIVQADALEYLQSLPSDSVHCMITSPPYWGLRDYGVAGQLGLEPTLTEYLDTLTAVFREARRVLRGDGVLWLNMGDSYVSTGYTNDDGTKNIGGQGDHSLNKGHQTRVGKKAGEQHGLKPKDLIGQPWRLAFRLQDDGWFVRSDIILHKPNPMPESVTDRPTKSHEYIFLLTKSARYWYDSFAVREPHQDTTGRARYGEGGNNPNNKNNRNPGTNSKPHVFNEYRQSPAGRNKRTVWTVATHPLPQAHFASFPPKLIEPMILAGCPPKVCVVCGSPWERVTEIVTIPTQNTPNGSWDDSNGYQKSGWLPGKQEKSHTGWNPTCDHPDADTEPGIVLDMFMGAGTVALVAIQHGRRWMGCELKPEYIKIAEDRISAVQVDMFTSQGM
jgi:DNA modification methylase